MPNKFEIIEFPHHKDARGGLVPFEFDDDFPIKVKRCYLVTSKDSKTVRGGHSHLIEDEVFVALNGEITALVNDGRGDKLITLNAPNQALVVRKDCWHEFFDFSPESILLCFSSTPYLPGAQNYIQDKADFLAKMK